MVPKESGIVLERIYFPTLLVSGSWIEKENSSQRGRRVILWNSNSWHPNLGRHWLKVILVTSSQKVPRRKMTVRDLLLEILPHAREMNWRAGDLWDLSKVEVRGKTTCEDFRLFSMTWNVCPFLFHDHGASGVALFSILSTTMWLRLHSVQTFHSPHLFALLKGLLMNGFPSSFFLKALSAKVPDWRSQNVPVKLSGVRKCFTELTRSEANDSVETFNSFLASYPISQETELLCDLPATRSVLCCSPEAYSSTMEKRKTELKKGKNDTLLSNMEVMRTRHVSCYC